MLEIVRRTPNSETLARIAYDNVLTVMGRNLANGKHEDGGWNEGAEANPKWHLHRAVRHCVQAMMLMDGVEPKDRENIETHVRHALARATLALAQVTGAAS
jgi:hypothetical protein